jgi:hypothetical protein
MANFSSEDLGSLADAISKSVREAMGGGGGGGRSIDLEQQGKDLKREMENFVSGLKKAQPAWKSVTDTIKGTGPAFDQTLAPAIDRFQKEIEKAKNALVASNAMEAGTEKDKAQQSAVNKIKHNQDMQLKAQAAMKMSLLSTVIGGTASAFGTLALKIVDIGLEYTKGIIDNKSANDLYTGTMISTAKATGEFGSAIAKIIEVVGGVLTILSFLPTPLGAALKIFRWLGPVIGIAGAALDKLAVKAADLAVKGLEILNAQLNKTQTAFKTITSTGATLAQGMTGLSNITSASGIDIKDFADGVKAAGQSVNRMGFTSDAAIKKLASIQKALRGNELGEGLDKLGYSVSEQVELSAQVMERMRATGDKRINSDIDVAKATLDYGKNLKILNGITDGNAKKALQEAQLKAMEAGFIAKAAEISKDTGQTMAEVQAKQAAQLVVFKQMGSVAEMAYLEFAQTGTIVNKESRILYEQNQEFKKMVDGSVGILRDKTKTDKDASAEAVEAGRRSSNAQIEFAKSIEGMSQTTAALLGSNGTLQALMKGSNDLIAFSLKTVEDQVGRGKKEADAAAANKAKLDDNMAKAEEFRQKLSAALTGRMLPEIEKFTTHMIKQQNLQSEVAKQMEAVIVAVNKALGILDKTIDDTTSSTTGNAGSASYAVTPGGGVTAIMNREQSFRPDSIMGRLRSRQRQDAQPGGPITQTMKPDDPARYGDLPIGGSSPGEAIAGGAATQQIIEAAKKLNAAYPGGRFNAFNDTLPIHAKSNHGKGQAMDWTPPQALLTQIQGNPGVGKDLIKTMTAMGFSYAKDEINDRAGGTGPHIHGEAMANGGIVSPSSSGLNATIGEGGRSELVTPLKNGRIPGMDELIERFDTMISVMKTVGSNTDKMYKAVA